MGAAVRFSKKVSFELTSEDVYWLIYVLMDKVLAMLEKKNQF